MVLSWSSWVASGMANLPGYDVHWSNEGVCGPRGKRASISNYGCEDNPNPCSTNSHEDMILETAVVSALPNNVHCSIDCL